MTDYSVFWVFSLKRNMILHTEFALMSQLIATRKLSQEDVVKCYTQNNQQLHN